MGQATARILETTPPDFIPENELISGDEQHVETPWHRKEIGLFLDVARQALAGQGRDDSFLGGDMFVYYSAEQARAMAQEVPRQLTLFGGTLVPYVVTAEEPGKKYFKGPDVFAVVGGVERRRRDVWASWLEGGRLPDFVFELQSPSTAKIDAGEKKELYAKVFKAREYFYYGPDKPELGRYRDVLVGLRLAPSGSYEAIEPDARGWLWSEVLGARVGRWDAEPDDYGDSRWIRLYDARGHLIPTREEAAHQEAEAARREAVAERRRAEAAEAEVARLKKLLGE